MTKPPQCERKSRKRSKVLVDLSHTTHHWGTSHDGDRCICTNCECSPLSDMAKSVCIAHNNYERWRLIQLIEKEDLTSLDAEEIKEIWSKSYGNYNRD